jgi:hypothetical protein
MKMKKEQRRIGTTKQIEDAGANVPIKSETYWQYSGVLTKLTSTSFLFNFEF